MKKQYIYGSIIFITAILISGIILFSDIFKKQTNEIDNNIKMQASEEIIKQDEKIEYELEKREFIINSEIALINELELLSADNWNIYHNEKYKYELKYPNILYLYKRDLFPEEKESDYLKYASFSTTSTGDSPNDRITPWSRITTQIIEKSLTQSLQDWLKEEFENNYGPGGDSAVQSVILKNKEFLGSYTDALNFKKLNWKNAYFELPDGNILKLSLMIQVEDLDYSKIFYTMIDSLKFE